MQALTMPAQDGALPRIVSATKLDTPQVSRHHIVRERIIDKILARGNARIVLVQAPAGFGKTTVLNQARAALEGAGVRTIWMNADSSDNDAIRFLTCLSSGVDRGCRNGESPILDTFETEGRGVNDLALALLDRIRGANLRFCVFIDEFESISHPAVLGLVKEIIRHLPAVGTLVIGSRSVPDLGLGRLRSHGMLVELGPEDLRFTYEETREFLRERRGLKLEDTHIDRLHRRTEGWISALWLASVTLERRPRADAFIDEFDGTTNTIADYLAEDVVLSLPSAHREFLLKTSILRNLSASLCNAVCQRDDSNAMLDATEKANLFLAPLDDKRQWFRYHGLFADFLRAQLARQFPELPRQLSRRAAEWYVRQGRPIPAIEQALAGGDYDYAVPLIEQHAFRLLVEGRIRLLVRWLDTLPQPVLAANPLLQVAHLWAITLTRGQSEAMPLLEKLEQDGNLDEAAMAYALALRPLLLSLQDSMEEAYAAAADYASRIPLTYAFPYGLVMNCLAQLSLINGHYAEARRVVADTYAAMGDKIGAFNLIFTETVEADIDLLHGNLRQALVRLRQASSVAASPAHPINGNAKAGISLAVALYEADDWTMAERLLDICLPLIQELQLPDWLICGHVTLSRIANIRGDSSRALQLLAELECIGHKSRLPRVAASARLERARLALLDGNLANARDELAHAGGRDYWDRIEALSTFANDVENLTVAQGRYLIRSGAAAEAVPMLQRSLITAQQARRERRALKLKILLAASHAAMGNRAAGRKQMAEALAFGAREGFVRSFIEEGGAIMVLLHDLARPDDEGEKKPVHSFPESYLHRLLRAEGACRTEMEEPAEEHEALTRKELDVVEMLAEGGSNKIIARRLGIAETTVRTHLRSISVKLNANNRTQIVFIARRLGLIE